MRKVLADEAQPQPRRQFAFDLLKRGGDPEATPIFARLLDIEAFRSAVIPLLSRSTDPATAQALMQRFPQLNPADRSAALATLTSRTVLALPLLQAVQSGNFDRNYLSALQVRQMRNLHDAGVDRLLDEAWGKVNESSDAAKVTIARLKQAYTAAPLWAYDANAGHETFNQVCAVCHALNGVGGKLGPDLAGSWRNGLDYFLENIVDPNAVVGENYQLHVLTKKDGAVVSGLLEQESATAITLRTVTEPVIVAKADLKDHQKLAQSLMPPGLLEALPERKADRVAEIPHQQTMKPDLIVAACVATLLGFASLAGATQTDTYGLHAVPTPGQVTIDGDLSDWDLSGQTLMCYDVEALQDIYSAKVAVMRRGQSLRRHSLGP